MDDPQQTKAPAFQFYPKQWLGDDLVMLMDWDARAMHMHFMCIAWQQTPPCTLPADDALLRKWVGSPDDWERIKEQVFRAWKLEDGRWVQQGLLSSFTKRNQYVESRKHNAEKRWKGPKNTDAYASRMHPNENAHAEHMQCSSTSSSTSYKEEPPIVPRSGDVSESDQPKESGVRKEFEEDWPKFWQRVGKDAAFRAYTKARKRAKRETIMAAVVEHGPLITAHAARQGITAVHPASWLNAGRWDDDVAIYADTGKGKGKSKTAMIFREMHAEPKGTCELCGDTGKRVKPGIDANPNWFELPASEVYEACSCRKKASAA